MAIPTQADQLTLAPIPDAHLELEKAVLGSILIDPVGMGAALGLGLQVDDFYADKHCVIYSMMASLTKQGKPATLLMLTNALEDSGQLGKGKAVDEDYITTLVNDVETSGYIEFYIGEVKRHGKARREAATKLTAMKILASDAPDAAQLAQEFIADFRASEAEREPTITEDTHPYHLLTVQELEDLAVTSFDWLVDRTIPKECVFGIAGESGSGKTFLSTDLAGSLATNAPFFDLAVNAPGAVVYIAAEGASGFGLRIRAWRQRHGADQSIPIRTVKVAVPLLKPDRVNDLIARIHAEVPDQDISAIFVDTMNASFEGGEENSNDDMGEFCRVLRRLSQEFHTAVCPVHHTGVNGKERGATAWRAAMDVILFVTRNHQTGISTFTNNQKDGGKMRDGAAPFDAPKGFTLDTVRFDEPGWDKFTTCVVMPCDAPLAPPPDRPSPTEGKILHIFAQNGPMGFGAWHNAALNCGITESAWNSGYKRLREKGYVMKSEENNLWGMTQKAKTYLDAQGVQGVQNGVQGNLHPSDSGGEIGVQRGANPLGLHPMHPSPITADVAPDMQEPINIADVRRWVQVNVVPMSASAPPETRESNHLAPPDDGESA